MKRRTFLELALVLGAGGLAAKVGRSPSLAWSAAEGFPGMRVRLEGALGQAHRLQIVDDDGVTRRVLLDAPLAEAPSEWRIPSLRADLVEATHELEARVVDASGAVVARTEAPLTVRFRAFRFST